MENNSDLELVFKLKAAGEIGDAHKAIQRLALAFPNDPLIQDVLHKLRMELLSKQQLDAMIKSNEVMERSAQSMAQILTHLILPGRILTCSVVRSVALQIFCQLKNRKNAQSISRCPSPLQFTLSRFVCS